MLFRPIYESLQGRIVLFSVKRKRNKAATSFKGRISWIFTQTIRQPLKSSLMFVIAILFMISIGFLQEQIQRTVNHIEYLYAETTLNAEVSRLYTVSGFVQPSVSPIAPGFLIDGVFHTAFIDNIREASFVADLYVEAGNIRGIVLPSSVESFYDDWQSEVGFYLEEGLIGNIPVLNFLYGFSDLSEFIIRNTFSYYDENLADIKIIFAEGLDYSHFNEGAFDGLVPIIVYEGTLYDRSLNLGDRTILAYATSGLSNMNYEEAIIIASHNGVIYGSNISNATLLPIYYLEEMFGIFLSYTTVYFTISPYYNRNLPYVRERLESYVSRGGFVPLDLFLRDEQFLNQIILLEQTLIILETLYPLALMFTVLVLSLVILLLTMQSMKSAAVMRVIGNSRSKVIINIASETMVIFVTGVLIGLIFLLSINWGLGFLNLALVFLIYIVTITFIAISAAFVITNKPPLYMLQVRE